MAEEDAPEPMPRMDQQMREASLWFARMRGPDAEEWRPQFENWLALGASHRGAYNRAGEIFALGRFMAAQDEEHAGEANDNDERGHHLRQAAIAACLLLTLGIGGWIAKVELSGPGAVPVQVAQQANGPATEHDRYGTADGSRRTAKLADGSVVDLEGHSELVTNFGVARRELRLERGRARFNVAHESRPFVVLAGGGSVTARGTVFDVILGDDRRVTVHLLRGEVDVERPGSGAKGTRGAAAVARLEPGEILSFAMVTPTAFPKAMGKPEVQPVSPVPELALVREFERTPLSAVVAEANRDSATSIRLSDPSLGALRVSGRFRVNDADQVAERLATLFDLEVEKTKPDEITLRKR
ncbi:MAG: FecR domain-containing protein [Sphingobium sp.]|uniref:FecR family protein n=1 Tax=Sphingobium sp. TaxID=1912891 RepID=UPI003BB188D8